MLIDTHAHLYSAEFEDDVNNAVLRAKQAGVTAILLPNIDENSIAPMQHIVRQHPGYLIPMMGLHPTSVTQDYQRQLEIIYTELNSNKYIAIGEIGIDLHWDTSMLNQQTDAFEKQLEWSIEKNLPVAIHFRKATSEVIQSIKKIGKDRLRGVFHSFGGNKEELKEILDLGNFMIGINGVVTFKNSGLAETLIHCPKEKVILETDSPYLAPVPYRGKRNEPSYAVEVLQKLSKIWEKTEDETAQITGANARNLFRILN